MLILKMCVGVLVVGVLVLGWVLGLGFGWGFRIGFGFGLREGFGLEFKFVLVELVKNILFVNVLLLGRFMLIVLKFRFKEFLVGMDVF